MSTDPIFNPELRVAYEGRLGGLIKPQKKPVKKEKSTEVLPTLFKRIMEGDMYSREGRARAKKICVALNKRSNHGAVKYGSVLTSHNGRDVLRDLEEELLDALAYSEQFALEHPRSVIAHSDIFHHIYNALCDIERYRNGKKRNNSVGKEKHRRVGRD